MRPAAAGRAPLPAGPRCCLPADRLCSLAPTRLPPPAHPPAHSPTRPRAEAGKDEGAADFLSSVEVLVAERADVLLMQNWAHVATVVAALNRIPRDGHGVDMMRVRDWALRRA